MTQKRIEDYGIVIGKFKRGLKNKITDVPGVKVGHCTLDDGDIKTGVTAIMPLAENIFNNKLIAASHVINGYGKTIGLIQIDELGMLESPILLTNTFSVGCVADALVDYTVARCLSEDTQCLSFNPVVGECNDSYLNAIQKRAVKSEHVFRAIENASEEFLEGDVGAGKGMSCHNLKGGIGSASRILEFANSNFTLGVLVLANYGSLSDLMIDGDKVGLELQDQISNKTTVDQGSIIIVLATDLPLSDRQMKRVLKRAPIGMARVGSYIGHGSGDIVIGFTTYENQSSETHEIIKKVSQLNENYLENVFKSFSDCVEESILNALITAERTEGVNGHTREALKTLWTTKYESKDQKDQKYSL